MTTHATQQRAASAASRPLALLLLLLALSSPARAASLPASAAAVQLPAPATRATIGGICQADNECDGSLICAFGEDGKILPCNGRVCACAPNFNNVVACSNSESCADDDVCVKLFAIFGVCAPCATLGDDSPDLLGSRTCSGNAGAPVDDNGVCVDARLLRKRDGVMLRDGTVRTAAGTGSSSSSTTTHPTVFPADRLARVLCDRNGSCATPAHIVTLRGRAMSMATYCASHADGPCSQAVIRVNSPAMRRGLRVATPTDGLPFTALSARFGTRAEELALAGLVRVGF